MQLCGKPLSSRSRFSKPGLHRCYKVRGHSGKCSEFPYLEHLTRVAPRVARKIVRDSVMTTGAAWKSKDGGPNRIRRWVMLLSDEELLKLGIDMTRFSAVIVAKLREKAAQYTDCMQCAQKLTWLAYGMQNAPGPPDEIREYLEGLFGGIQEGSTTCLICLAPLDFHLFDKARRGKAEIETSHRNPRVHTPENIAFAHRDCNIAQGNKTLDEFYEWTARILRKAGYDVHKKS